MSEASDSVESMTLEERNFPCLKGYNPNCTAPQFWRDDTNTWSYFYETYGKYSRVYYSLENPYFVKRKCHGEDKDKLSYFNNDEDIYFFEESPSYWFRHWNHVNVFNEYEEFLKENPGKKENDRITPREHRKALMKTNNRICEIEESSLEEYETIENKIFISVKKMLHKESGKLIAVKIIERNYLNYRLLFDFGDLEDKVREIDHANIVKFYGVLYREKDLWVCSEFLEVSIYRLIRQFYHDICHKKPKYLPEQLSWRIAASILDALEYLYAKLDIHFGELCSRNVLISKVGEIKVTAFSGCPINPLHKIVTNYNSVYIAPERIFRKCKEKYEEGSDIWSLGLILFELATGSYPFAVGTLEIEQIKSDFSKLPCIKLNKDEATQYGMTEGMMLFINKCLEWDIKSRGKISEMKGQLSSAFSQNEVAEYIKKLKDKSLAFKKIPVDYRGVPVSLAGCKCCDCQKFDISDEL